MPVISCEVRRLPTTETLLGAGMSRLFLCVSPVQIAVIVYRRLEKVEGALNLKLLKEGSLAIYFLRRVGGGTSPRALLTAVRSS